MPKPTTQAAKQNRNTPSLDALAASVQAAHAAGDSKTAKRLESELVARCDGGLRQVAADYVCGENFEDLLQLARLACIKLAREVPPAVPFFARLMWKARQACSTYSASRSGDVYIPERTNRGRERPAYTTRHEEAGDESTPETLLSDRQMIHALRRLVGKLPGRERELVAWVHEIGRDKKAYRALAFEWRISPSAAYALLMRGQERLAEMWLEEEDA